MKNILPSLAILLVILGVHLALSQKVTMTSFPIDGLVQDIVWCGQEDVSNIWDPSENSTSQPIYIKKTVFVLSAKGTVYRSVDEGKNFENLKPKLESASGSSAKYFHEKNHDIGTIRKIYTSEVDAKFLIFHGTFGVSYITEDCGSNIKMFEHPEEFVEFKLNPVDKNYVLAASRQECNENSPEFCSSLLDLHYSEKMGLHWTKVQSWVIEFSWACNNKFYKHLIPFERIIITKANEDKKDELETKILFTDNMFQNTAVISTKGYRFFMTNEFLYILEAEDLKEKKFSLKLCPNYYRDYRLSPVDLPIQRLKDHSFTILDSSESTIFINVNHYGDEAKFGNVYVSNYEGRKFVLSLLHNVRDEKGFCDFDKVKSLEGVFIANHYEHVEAEKYKSSYNYYSNPSDRAAAKHEGIDAFKKSVITYDKGSYWYPIPAPEYDIDGKKLECHGECSLHLRGFTDKYSNPLYSSESSIGIIMGVGNTGLYLAQKPEEVNTYLSRDGGHSWVQVDKGSYIYEIGDHGGLIVMADDSKPTRTVKYSWDEGLHWEYFTFSEEDVDITNIIIEPMNMAMKFLVYGRKTTNLNNEGVIYFLNFASLKRRVCSGVWNPGAEDSDYEIWIPGSHDQAKCLFGKRMKYVRRKREADCFNGEDYEKKNIVDFCPCGEEDWECDFGFYRKEETKECIPISSEFQNKMNNFTEPENCTDFYEVPSGYRKVPGDYCVGGVDKAMARVLRCSKAAKMDMQQNMPGRLGMHQGEKIEEQSHFLRNLKIGFCVLLVSVFLFIFRENFLEFIVKVLSFFKNLQKKSDERGHAQRKDYERVGAPLKSMNDDEDDEENN